MGYETKCGRVHRGDAETQRRQREATLNRRELPSGRLWLCYELSFLKSFLSVSAAQR
jgi:hypothetical protein